MKTIFKSIIIIVIYIITYGCKDEDIKTGKVKDIDGNVYKTVTIGTQTWMAENLKTTRYNDGVEISNVTDDTEWTNLETGAYCNYDNLETNATKYGRLYNFFAVNTGKLAPKGWHVATDDDWTILVNYLIANGYNYDGTKDEDKVAKSLCTKTSWNLSSEAGTPGAVPDNNNSSGFSALPGGYLNGGFYNAGLGGYWWSPSELGTSYGAGLRALFFNDNHMFLNLENYSWSSGFSVRCLRDN